MKTKHIIAREGLIILSIIFTGIVFLFISWQIPSDLSQYSDQELKNMLKQKENSRSDLSQYSDEELNNMLKQQESSSPDLSQYSDQELQNMLDDQQQQPNDALLRQNFAQAHPVMTGAENESDWVDVPWPSQQNAFRYHLRNFFSTTSLIILILFYPLYLVLRFVIWAIKTLKERDKG